MKNNGLLGKKKLQTIIKSQTIGFIWWLNIDIDLFIFGLISDTKSYTVNMTKQNV